MLHDKKFHRGAEIIFRAPDGQWCAWEGRTGIVQSGVTWCNECRTHHCYAVAVDSKVGPLVYNWCAKWLQPTLTTLIAAKGA